jgi:hypothetical protein
LRNQGNGEQKRKYSNDDSQPSRHIPVPSFGRFDEITYLVENAAALTQSVTKWAS